MAAIITLAAGRGEAPRTGVARPRGPNLDDQYLHDTGNDSAGCASSVLFEIEHGLAFVGLGAGQGEGDG
ncbi:hypothetical protein OG496_53520 [Streptomyces sp. NBC_00988]|uniref:hypothetical protein n=1 Tax=Streptomyces sp. NBC_00988 TaxID=2903704 RepID=UPI00386E2E15|nr:hypothetical protein OG496_53520 [Streptomyces sp. NBC_00988]